MASPTPTGQYLEAQQIHSCMHLNQDLSELKGAIRRYGTDFVNLQDMEREEEEHLATEIRDAFFKDDEKRFFGQSSDAMLLKTARDLKTAYHGRVFPPGTAVRRPGFWKENPVSHG